MNRQTLRVACLYPELLNLYGDSGNVLVLQSRMKWRGIGCEVVACHVGDTPTFTNVDIVCIGGGSDRDQLVVSQELPKCRRELAAFVEDGGVLQAVCGGYQLLGHFCRMGDTVLTGLSLVDLYTERAEPRLIGNIIIESSISPQPIVGYENHAGRTYLGDGMKPLGRVVVGQGNDGKTGFEGCWYKNVIGTYLHGPLLPKNPGVADYLIAKALERKYGSAELESLDDTIELAANSAMYERLMTGKTRV